MLSGGLRPWNKYFICAFYKRNRIPLFIYGRYNTTKTNFREWKLIETVSVPDSNIFTLMSYNILAQQYINSQAFLYSHHNQRKLEWQIRFNLLKQEIDTISPDILCLQEVQQCHLIEITTHFQKLGYHTELYKKRTGLQLDGCTIFFKKDKFELSEHQFLDFYRPNIHILNRCNVGILAKLKLKQANLKFVVSTTHLLFNPKREDIRLAQTQLLLAELEKFSRESSESNKYIPIILVGDFNAQQDSNVYQLIIGKNINIMKTGIKFHSKKPFGNRSILPNEMGITDACKYFEHANKNNILRKSSHFNSGTIKHNLNMISTVQAEEKLETGELASTFHKAWIMVDYIFYSKCDSNAPIIEPKLTLLQNLRLPTKDICITIGPIPNSKIGSDHYSVAAKFSIT